MGEYNNLCMNCMKKMSGSDPICHSCGFNNDSVQNPPYLPHRTILNERYLVGEMIDHSSDGITYMGYDLHQQAPITIREFMPRNLCTRISGNSQIVVLPGRERDYQECIQAFFDLWRSLGKMRELSAIIPVYDIFETNATAYAVSEYIESITLRDYLLRIPEGHMTWDKARPMLMPILSTLIALHNNGIIHRGISPNSMVFCRDGKVRLTGFSIWPANMQNSLIPFHEQSGYNALEQYDNDQQCGPWTDIYGYCATLYRALVGNIPIDALTREVNDKLMIPANLAEQIPAYVINAMGNGLQIYPKNRTRTVEQLRDQLSASPREVMANVQTYEKKPRQPEVYGETPPSSAAIVGPLHDEEYYNVKKAKRRDIIIAVTVGVVIVALIAGVGFYLKNKQNQNNHTEIANTTQAEQIAVPNFMDYTETEVKNSSSFNEQFDIEYEYEFSNDVASGYIMAQSVPSGSTFSKGGKITLTVSKGVETVTLSNYVGLTLTEAKAELEQAGFKVVVYTIENDGNKTAGTVYNQSLDANKSYKKGETIYLQVWGEASTTNLADVLSSAINNSTNR